MPALPLLIIGSIIPMRISIAIGAGVGIDIRSRGVVSIWIGLDITSIECAQYPHEQKDP